MFKKFFGFILELVKIVVISLVIIIPVRYFLIQPFYVKGASMEPNFHDSEYLIINEIGYQFKGPERGDVVVFRYPRNTEEYFIKRIIGLPGEKVKINDGAVYIFNNSDPEGFILKEDYLEEGTGTYSLSNGTVELSSDEYFVLGDNRTSSKDSRSFGPVDKKFLIGRVMLRGWPLERAGFIDKLQY